MSDESLANRRISDMSKQDIGKLKAEIKPKLAEFLSNLSGIEIKVRDSQVAGIIEFVKGLEAWQEKCRYIPDEQTRKRLLNEVLNLTFDAFGHGQFDEPLDAFLVVAYESFKNPSRSDFLSKTRYMEYRNIVFQLVKRLTEEGKLDEYNAFMNTVDENEVYNSTQLAIQIHKEVSFLQKKHRTITNATIRRYIHIHDLIGNLMEKHVRILYGIHEILAGKPADYQVLKKERNLTNLVGPLKEEKPYSVLLYPFNVSVRNAMSHGSVGLEPTAKRIRFDDNRHPVKRSYRPFMQDTRELYSSVLLLSKLQDGIVMYKFMLAKQHFDSLKEQKEPTPNAS